MARSTDVKKLSVWRRRLKRFERSSSTVAQFCQSEGVSSPSFYQWRKKVAAADADEEAGQSSRTSGAFTPVTLVPSATLVAELPGGTRLKMPMDDAVALRVAITEIAWADRQVHVGEASC